MSSFDDLGEEIAAEFSGFGAREFFGDGYGREQRTSKRAASRERVALVIMVRKAQLAEKAKKTAPKLCCCGKKLPKVPHKRGPHQGYCSARCYARDYYHRELKPIGAVMKSCQRCGAEFDQRGYLHKRFCSKPCQMARRAYP